MSSIQSSSIQYYVKKKVLSNVEGNLIHKRNLPVTSSGCSSEEILKGFSRQGMRPISRINWRRLKRYHDYFSMKIVALFIFDPRARLSEVLRFVATTKRLWCAINRPRPSSRLPDNAVCRSFKDTD